MRIPATPPRVSQEGNLISEVVNSLMTSGRARPKAAADQGPYLHWDEFRFKFSAESKGAIERKWLLLRLSRRLKSTQIHLTQLTGQHFSFCDLDSFRVALHQIDSNAGNVVTRPGPDIHEGSAGRYLQRSIVEEPFASSALEGAATTRAIARKLIEENRAPKTKDERMVLNNFRAMQFIKEHKNAPLTPALVLELHRVLTLDTLDNPDRCGEFRQSSDTVNVVDESTGEILHTPPPANQLKARVEALCAFANEGVQSTPFIHPLIQAIIAHFTLAYDHPFIDGNGRTARALFYWLALRKGYWLLEYVSISAILRKAPVKYGRAFLYVETDDGDLTYFIDHQIAVIEEAIAELHIYLDDHAKRASGMAAVLKAGFNQRQVQLLLDAVKRPSAKYTIAEQRDLHRVSYLTARKDLEDLAAHGMLVKKRVGAMSIFRPAPDLDKKIRSAKK